MHAGLECGVLGEKHSGMQMISVWAAYRGCAQPQRATEVLFGGAVLRFRDGAAGATLTRGRRGNRLLPDWSSA
jgi:hypothetical protein